MSSPRMPASHSTSISRPFVLPVNVYALAQRLSNQFLRGHFRFGDWEASLCGQMTVAPYSRFGRGTGRSTLRPQPTFAPVAFSGASFDVRMTFLELGLTGNSVIFLLSRRCPEFRWRFERRFSGLTRVESGWEKPQRKENRRGETI